MTVKEIVEAMSLEEKAVFLTGALSMKTVGSEKYGIKPANLADGPHGVRHGAEENCTLFPSLCNLGSSWNTDAAYRMGKSLAEDCIAHGVDLLLGPGINIKRNMLCGRNFEYFSEDPVLAGELAAGYINGLQSLGVGASLKHFALNNQETDRDFLSVEVDERTMREIYLKGFEIAVKKSQPASVMCAYNRINSIWCAENRQLLKEILKDEWGYQGVVVSDWGAVQDIGRSVAAGLDLQMPKNDEIVSQLKKAVKNGTVTEAEIDEALTRILHWLSEKKPAEVSYDRKKQHLSAGEVAADGMVLLKNQNQTLPITAEKYKKVVVFGEYAVNPLISGQGSAEVHPLPEYIDNPLTELQKRLPEVKFEYVEGYKTNQLSKEMLWGKVWKMFSEIEDADLYLVFAGAMDSDDTENYDRRSPYLNHNQELFLETAVSKNKPVAVVLQNGGALILGKWKNDADAVLECWLGGEATGSAVADVLCGKVNPSGKLSETFPNRMRNETVFAGENLKIAYSEKLDVGYRYYDKHPEEIDFPFGHGLSYTQFEYSDISISADENITVSFVLKNSGEVGGAEVAQLYVGNPTATVDRPIKELKQFKKVYLNPNESTKITFVLKPEEIAYYNTMLHNWVAESGIYNIFIGSSSRDIRLSGQCVYENPNMPYSLDKRGFTMIG